MITALCVSIFVLLCAGLLAYLTQKFFPAENKYKDAALAVLGLLVLIIVVALIFPPIGDAIGVHVGKSDVKQELRR